MAHAKTSQKSKLEAALWFQVNAILPDEPWEQEHKFLFSRKWRFDIAHVGHRIGIECEGLTYYGKNKDGSMKLGRHQTAKGYADDLEKYNAAAEMGWVVLRFDKQAIKSGHAVAQIERVLFKMKEGGLR